MSPVGTKQSLSPTQFYVCFRGECGHSERQTARAPLSVIQPTPHTGVSIALASLLLGRRLWWFRYGGRHRYVRWQLYRRRLWCWGWFRRWPRWFWQAHWLYPSLLQVKGCGRSPLRTVRGSTKQERPLMPSIKMGGSMPGTWLSIAYEGWAEGKKRSRPFRM